ncbi:hypothetical protein HEHE104102_08280 [Helicobacter hepaticus]
MIKGKRHLRVLGIKAKSSTESIVNIVIECPDGRLFVPASRSPMILKVFSKARAGRGIA